MPKQIHRGNPVRTGLLWVERIAVHVKCVLAPIVLLVICAACQSDFSTAINRVLGNPSYPLDTLDRDVGYDAGILVCPEINKTWVKGSSPAFSPPLEVAEAFAPRVEELRVIAAQLGQALYKRAPRTILNAGAYRCRPVAHRENRLSEHAFGNAVDVIGFEFPPFVDAGHGGAAPQPPTEYRGRFSIRVSQHWQTTGKHERHQRYLRRLVEELQRAEVFRGYIGPSAPMHQGHLHFDMGRWAFERL